MNRKNVRDSDNRDPPDEATTRPGDKPAIPSTGSGSVEPNAGKVDTLPLKMEVVSSPVSTGSGSVEPVRTAPDGGEEPDFDPKVRKSVNPIGEHDQGRVKGTHPPGEEVKPGAGGQPTKADRIKIGKGEQTPSELLNGGPLKGIDALAEKDEANPLGLLQEVHAAMYETNMHRSRPTLVARLERAISTAQEYQAGETTVPEKTAASSR
jgi:hypothetical protein